MSSSWSSHSQVNRSNNILRHHESKPLLKTNMGAKIRRVLLRARTYNFTLAAVVSICTFCALISLPAYIYPTVREHVFLNGTNQSNSESNVYVYQVQASDLDISTGGLIFRLTFYTWAIVGKLIPCALLFVFSALLVRSLVSIGRKSHV